MVYSQSQMDLVQIFVHHRVSKHLRFVLCQHAVVDVRAGTHVVVNTR